MFAPQQRALALALLIAYPLAAHAADTATSVDAANASAADGAADSSKPQSLPEVQVTGSRQRLDAARNGLSPDTGSSVYRLDAKSIEALPQGDSTPLNQIILQTPGVVQDSYGQLHVRGDHGNVQYRINGVVIPESISGFGQSLESRFADHISVLTGALPAQYGYRTAAIIDIQTKGENADQGSTISTTLGGHGTTETSLETGGTRGDLTYYLTGSYERNGIGIENPTPAADPLHDATQQAKGFGYLSYVLGNDSRVSLMFGSSNNRFQIPDVPGQTPNYTLAAEPPADSSTLNAQQSETNRFAVLTYQGSIGYDVDYQVSLFQRDSQVHYQPDTVGDLEYLGIADNILRRNNASGVQADMSYRLNTEHTLRAGLFAQREHAPTDTQASVFPAGSDGTQSSNVPEQISDSYTVGGHLWGVYAQDEWQIAKGVTVNYGARYDQADTVVNEHQLSPRLGLVLELNPDLHLHAGYARYFTPPPTESIDQTSVQLFQGTTNALPSNANTAVKSERSDYYDAGLAYQLSPKATLNVDGYYRNIRHLQDEGQFGNALIYSAFNYAKGLIYGLDVSANYHDEGFASYLNLGFTHARGTQVETGQFNFDPTELAYINANWVHLDHEQKLSASAGTSYRFADGINLSADALYGSGLRNGFANTTNLPAYTTFNVAVAKTLYLGGMVGKVDVRLSVDNLFDRTYELRDGTGIGVGAPQYGLRRTAYLNLAKNF